jgi:hypothetical protein
MIGIYKIISPTRKVYIGQSIDIERRWREHKKIIKGKHTKFYHSLQKYGEKEHIFEILEECDVCDLSVKETFYKTQFINEFGWDNALFCFLVDGINGGYLCQETKDKISNGLIGRKLSEETKLKISIAKTGHLCFKDDKWKKKIGDSNRGYKRTEETKTKMRIPKPTGFSENLSIANKGKKLGIKPSQETKNKMSKAHIGIPKSKEHKINISKAKMGQTHSKGYKYTDIQKFNITLGKSKPFICIEINQTFHNPRIASENLKIGNTGIRDVLKGLKENHRGYTFKYI